LSFFLGGQEYATDILRVQEIKGWDTVIRVALFGPTTFLASSIFGGRSFRWSIRECGFALKSAPFDSATVVIVVRVEGARGERIVGLVVRCVSTCTASRENITASEAVGSVDQMFVLGLATPPHHDDDGCGVEGALF